jgi:hypothetical protein
MAEKALAEIEINILIDFYYIVKIYFEILLNKVRFKFNNKKEN